MPSMDTSSTRDSSTSSSPFVGSVASATGDGSVGGGLLFMFQLVGGAIGVVLTTTVFDAAGEDHSGPAAFVDGLHAGLRLDAALAFAALGAAFWVVRRRAPTASPAGD